MKIKKIILFSLLLSTVPTAHATAMTNLAELFPFAAQSHSNAGKIEMDKGSNINGVYVNNKIGYLNFAKLDKHEGKCNTFDCKLNGNFTSVQRDKITFNDFPNFEFSFKNPSESSSLTKKDQKCIGEIKVSDNGNSFKDLQVEDGCELRLTTDKSDIYINTLKVKSGGKIHMPKADYWIKEVDIEGGGLIVSGSANFYVSGSDNVDIKNAGEISNVHIHAPNADIKVEKTNFTGSLFTNKVLKIRDNSTVKGNIKAKEVEVGSDEDDDDDDRKDVSTLVLSSSDYIFNRMEIKKQSIIESLSSVTIFINKELELEENSRLGNKDYPVTVFVYDNDDDAVELKKNAKLYGFVYTNGELELEDDAGIYGAVNVKKLEMKKNSFINADEDYMPVNGVHHYRLDYSTSTEKLTAYACANSSCNFYYQDMVKKLHIKDGINNNNIANFKSFYKISAAESYTPKSKDKCVQFSIHNPSTDPLPSATPGLRCWKDGASLGDCRLCQEEELPAVELAGFVFGDITITDQHLKGISPGATLTIDEIVSQGILTNTKTGAVLTKNMAVTLPLTVSYDKAESVTLKAKETLSNQLTIYREVKIAFVPKQLRWKTTAECIDEAGFNYDKYASKCDVLGKAGESVELSLQAYGAGDNLVNDYKVTLSNIEIRQLNANSEELKGFKQNEFNFSQQGQNKFGTSSAIDTVALVQAYISEHCASYALKEGSCLKKTLGDTAIMGRTVPASLLVKEIENGKVADGFVYAAQPDDVAFSTIPSFTIQGLDTNKKPLPSYTGEFAGGLLGSSEIKLDSKLSDSALTLRYSEPNNDGSHKLELVSTSLKFLKDKPFGETSLDLPLDLTIIAHDQTQGLTGKTNLGSNDDKLRYGFLVLKDTELAVDQSGEMQSELHYYSDNTATTAVDKDKGYNLKSLSLTLGIKSAATTSENPTVELAAKKLDVSAFSKIWRGDVTIEGDSSDFVWLKPYSKVTSQLVNPKGQLTISDRKRGNDKVFNRREVVR